METRNIRQSVCKFIFITCGIWLIGIGLYFMVLRPPLLPEDLLYMGIRPGEIQSAMRGLDRCTTFSL